MNWDRYENAGSFTHFRIDIEYALHDLDTGVDMAEAETVLSSGPGRVKSIPVINDLNDELFTIALNKIDRGVPGLAMLDDVVDQFFNYAVDLDLELLVVTFDTVIIRDEFQF